MKVNIIKWRENARLSLTPESEAESVYLEQLIPLLRDNSWDYQRPQPIPGFSEYYGTSIPLVKREN